MPNKTSENYKTLTQLNGSKGIRTKEFGTYISTNSYTHTHISLLSILKNYYHNLNIKNIHCRKIICMSWVGNEEYVK